MAKDKQERAKSWFCVLNNPEENMPFLKGKSPEEMTKTLCEMWQKEKGENCSCAVAYCISAKGLHHLHLVLENPNKVGFEQVREFLGGKGHIEATRGTKAQAEDYIYKRGAFEEKGEKIVHIFTRGEIKGCQGRRNELSYIDQLLEEGKRPDEIFEELGLTARRYEGMIKAAFFDKRIKETPRKRDVSVIWHVGRTGSGKSRCYEVDSRPDDEIKVVPGHLLSTPGAFDDYFGQEVLFIDEFKGGDCKYGFLLTLLDGYRFPIACRYRNGVALWKEVIITSAFTAEEIYRKMVANEDSDIDSISQLKGRITKTVYHFAVNKDTGDFIKDPRVEALKNPGSLEYREIEFVGYVSREQIEDRLEKELYYIQQEKAKAPKDWVEEISDGDAEEFF